MSRRKRPTLRSYLHTVVRFISDYFAFLIFLVLGGSIFGAVVSMLGGATALELIFWRSGFSIALVIVTLLWLDDLLDDH